MINCEWELFCRYQQAQEGTEIGTILLLAQRFRLRPQEVLAILDAYGAQLPEGLLFHQEPHKRHRVFSPALDAQLLELAKQGLGPSRIALLLGLKREQVRNRLYRLRRMARKAGGVV